MDESADACGGTTWTMRCANGYTPGQIDKEKEELEWRQLLPLPNRFLGYKDPRSGILLYLSWLLTDLYDWNWPRFTPMQLARFLRDLADSIESSTNPVSLLS